MSLPYGIIYLITNLVNGKQYVGQTICTLQKRWRGHQHTRSGCTRLSNAVKKYGPSSFLVEQVFSCSSKQELNDMETKCILALMTHHHGYNCNTGGDSCKPTDITRERLSAAKVGRRHSLATRQKMSASAKGRPKTPEAKANMSRAATGRKMSPSARAKMSQSFTGRVHTPEARAKMVAAARARWTPEARARMSAIQKQRRQLMNATEV